MSSKITPQKILSENMNNSPPKVASASSDEPCSATNFPKLYRVKFRLGLQSHSAVTKINNLRDGELVMVKTDHGLEPAMITGFSASFPESGRKKLANYNIIRRANREETDKFDGWGKREDAAFKVCRAEIEELGLPMKLVRVERFFNGSNIVFYFTADNRVDFRDLVKKLVQEFRTRVEMRQVGVRHETKMVGGIGYCGRELCCSSFMKKFVPVSIKMVKEQDLPLNPTKISGVCNRLLCCLTHEFSTYKSCKKGMPKQGKIVELNGRKYRIVHRNILQETVKLIALSDSDDIIVLGREEWGRIKVVAGSHGKEEGQSQKTSKSQKSDSKPQNKKDSAKDKKTIRNKGKVKASSAKSTRKPRTNKPHRPRKGKK